MVETIKFNIELEESFLWLALVRGAELQLSLRQNLSVSELHQHLAVFIRLVFHGILSKLDVNLSEVIDASGIDPELGLKGLEDEIAFVHRDTLKHFLLLL